MPARRRPNLNAVDAHVELARATWPQIDPDVEGIVVRVGRIAGLLDVAPGDNLRRVGLTKEEFKVLCALHGGDQSHKTLCADLAVSTGAMTNRLRKPPRGRFVARPPAP